MSNEFNSLDFERKFWFLGLFCTDGHFDGKNSITFNQQVQDRDILEKVCYILDIPVLRLQENKCKKPSGEMGEYVRLRINKSHCPSLMEFLRMSGFGSNKTFNMPTIEVPDSAVRHFLRGVIDGDGGVYDEHVLKVDMCTASSNFADFLVVLIKRMLPTLKVHKYTIPFEKTDMAKSDLYKIEITGKDAEKLLLQIYDSTEFYGQRKLRNFLQAKNQQNKSVSIYRSWTERKGIDQEIEGVQIIEGKSFADTRGYLSECYRCDTLLSPAHLVYVSLTHPGLRRGPHIHLSQTDIFTFGVAGMYKIWLLDDRESSPTYKNVRVLYGGRDNWLRVSVPPGVVHAYQNISDEDGLSINCVSRLYAGLNKKYEVDEIRLDNTEFADYLFGL